MKRGGRKIAVFGHKWEDLLASQALQEDSIAEVERFAEADRRKRASAALILTLGIIPLCILGGMLLVAENLKMAALCLAGVAFTAICTSTLLPSGGRVKIDGRRRWSVVPEWRSEPVIREVLSKWPPGDPALAEVLACAAEINGMAKRLWERADACQKRINRIGHRDERDRLIDEKRKLSKTEPEPTLQNLYISQADYLEAHRAALKASTEELDASNALLARLAVVRERMDKMVKEAVENPEYTASALEDLQLLLPAIRKTEQQIVEESEAALVQQA